MSITIATTSAKAAPWTVQRENFHWILKNLRDANFLGLPCMVESMQSRITLSLSRGKLTVKVGTDGRAVFAYENGTVCNSSEPRFVPSRQIAGHVSSYLKYLSHLGLRY